MPYSSEKSGNLQVRRINDTKKCTKLLRFFHRFRIILDKNMGNENVRRPNNAARGRRHPFFLIIYNSMKVCERRGNKIIRKKVALYEFGKFITNLFCK